MIDDVELFDLACALRGGVATTTYRTGPGSTYVLVPARGETRHDLRALADDLDLVGTVVLVEAPRAAGRALDRRARAVLVVLAETGAHCVLVGRGGGADVARRAARLRPELVRGVVVVPSRRHRPLGDVRRVAAR
jgi:pimeloyl-ACP methyl ester carboxylesterase